MIAPTKRQPDSGAASAVLEVALDAIVSIDHEGVVIEFNPAAERTFGYVRAAAVGRPLAELIIPPPLREAHRQGLKRYLATGEGPILGRRLEMRAMRADGTEFPVELAVCRVPGSEPPTFTGFIRDLSESRRAAEALRFAEERSRRFEAEADARAERERADASAREAELLRQHLVAMLEATPDFAGFADARSTRVLYVNRAGRRMCGLADEEDVTGLHISDFHPEATNERLAEVALPAATRDGVWGGEMRFRHRDGREIPTLMVLMAHRGDDGEVEVFSTISRDITERKKAEEVERSLAAAEQAVRVRDDFVAVAGHELKTPLTALIMHVASMQRAVQLGRPLDVGERLEKLARSATRLESLVNQLLDVSRITADRLLLDPEVLDLTALVGEVVARFEEESVRPSSPVSIRGDEHVRGTWDRMRIDQVVTNLLSNAVKYGQGRPIAIEVVADAGHAVVRVIDHGIGIDHEHRARLFSRFERAVSTRQYGGFGLGLWIARQVVEASGGEIDVESEPGQGSTFTFRLPLTPAARREP